MKVMPLRFLFDLDLVIVKFQDSFLMCYIDRDCVDDFRILSGSEMGQIIQTAEGIAPELLGFDRSINIGKLPGIYSDAVRTYHNAIKTYSGGAVKRIFAENSLLLEWKTR